MIKRFILWLIRIVALLAGLVGILMIIGGALGMSNTLVAGIIVLVVSVCVNGISLRKSEKELTKSRRKCRKCGGSLAGAVYHYDSRIKVEKELGGKYVQVPVDVTCPHCGKVKTIIETIYYYDGKSIEEIKRDLEKQLQEYYK